MRQNYATKIKQNHTMSHVETVKEKDTGWHHAGVRPTLKYAKMKNTNMKLVQRDCCAHHRQEITAN